MTTQKTVYEEAIADVRKLKELAQQQACDLVMQKVEPRIKQLVEAQLFGEAEACAACGSVECECDMAEASAVASVAGTVSKPEDAVEESVDETQYEMAEGSERALASLAEFVRPMTDDRFVAEAYRLQETVTSLLTCSEQDKRSESFDQHLDETISKLEDMYEYLKENYAGQDSASIEEKLERSYGLANAVKESTMKMRDLLKEESLTMKINGLPDDVNLDGVTVDVVADEDAEAAPADGAEAAAPVAEPTAPMPEGDDMLEISESDLADALAGISEGSGVDDFGDGKEDKSAALDSLDEADGEDEEEELPPTKRYGEADDKGSVTEAARARLSRAASRLNEARDTDKEPLARAMYRSAIKNYRKARSTMVEGRATQPKPEANVPAKAATSVKAAVVNEAEVKKLTAQLAAANLLNAKLIHANRLLRLEGLTKAQQATVIDRLDEARSLREVRLISESLKNALVSNGKGSMVESASRRPTGAASRPSQSGAASSTLTEGLESARWAKLAGLK